MDLLMPFVAVNGMRAVRHSQISNPAGVGVCCKANTAVQLGWVLWWFRCCGCGSRQLPVLCPLQDVRAKSLAPLQLPAAWPVAHVPVVHGTTFFLASCCQGKWGSDRDQHIHII
jgi:hypothetical protein